MGRPFQASTFNLKAGSTYQAIAGSAVTDNTNSQAITSDGAVSIASFEIEILDSASALAAGAVAIAAVLAFWVW